MQPAELTFDARGLVTVVAQDYLSGEIRVLAHADRAAIERTLETGLGHFYSRSRQAIWKKGETSGNTLTVHAIWADCDGDALIYGVEPHGPSCHTGEQSCFFRPVGSDGRAIGRARPPLARLQKELEARRAAPASRSYTRSLLDGGADTIGAKLREEADELAEALARESDARVIAETADVLYHAIVGLVSRDLELRDVLAELERRAGTSGLAEKAARPR